MATKTMNRFERICDGYGFERVEFTSPDSGCSWCLGKTRRLFTQECQVPDGPGQEAFRRMQEKVRHSALCEHCVTYFYDGPDFDV